MRAPVRVASLLFVALCIAACSGASPAPPVTAPATVVTGDGVRATAAEQARMQAYIDAHVDPRFVRATLHQGDTAFDCVDFDRQPGCRDTPCGTPPAPPAPPPPPPGVTGAPPPGSPATSTLEACPQGTVPVRRLTLREMARFDTLEDYLRGNKGPPPAAP